MPLVSFSQGQGNNWCFGDSIGLHFDNGTVNLFNTAIGTSEIASTISDSTGNLLFYSGAGCIFANYSTIWDANNQIPLNGNLLYGSATITQGNLIIPIPGKNDFYFLFHIGNDYSSLPSIKLFLSIVDDSSQVKQIIQKIHLLLTALQKNFRLSGMPMEETGGYFVTKCIVILFIVF